MRHFLRLTLKQGKVEATVTCEDHVECHAYTLIQEDEKESGAYSEYPNFLDWYEGLDTPVRSGYINLELSENFVKWSYLDESYSLALQPVESVQHELFYEPFFTEKRGLVHRLKKTTHSSFTDETLEAYEESLEFIFGYNGPVTNYRTGFIKLIELNWGLTEEPDLYWEYAE
jgi:hypothetical protein